MVRSEEGDVLKAFEFNWDLGRQEECVIVDEFGGGREVEMASCWMVDKVEPVDVNPERFEE